MTINTFEFSKGLIIFIVYNMIILTSIKCYNSDVENILTVPDYDTKLILSDKLQSYFEYHFHNTSYPGQLKINPTGFFSSIYNCAYSVLPNVDYGLDDYSKYTSKFDELKAVYKRKLKDGFKDINILSDQESQYVELFKRAYNATKKAYEAVETFEKVKSENVNKFIKEDYEKKKNDAIKEYLQNQMPGLDYTPAYWGEDIGKTPRYVFENYELYINPTKEIYYMSKVKQAEYDVLSKRIKGTCNALDESEYFEVILLYNLLPEVTDSINDFEEFFAMLIKQYQESYENSATIFNTGFVVADDREKYGYSLTFKKLKSNFVVNNENYMSYLVRLKKQGYVGFHQIYHTSMYKIRKHYYDPVDYKIDMDIHQEDFEPRFHELRSMDKVSMENINLTF